jgi:hypothetical protein
LIPSLRSQAAPVPPLELELVEPELLDVEPELELVEPELLEVEPELLDVEPELELVELLVPLSVPASEVVDGAEGGGSFTLGCSGSADFVSAVRFPRSSSGAVAHAAMRATSDRPATEMRVDRSMASNLAARPRRRPQRDRSETHA